MDGPWQIGHRSAAQYGNLAAQTGRAMRMLDPRAHADRMRQLGAGHADLRGMGGDESFKRPMTWSI